MGKLDIFATAGMSQGEITNDRAVEIADEIEALEPMFTKQEIKAAFPPQLRAKVSDSLMGHLNSISADPDIASEIRDNFIGYHHIMKDGKYKMESYLAACAYVTYKMMGYSNAAAYRLTFPRRVARMLAAGKTEQNISSFVANYGKTKLVVTLLDQTLVPTHIMNQDLLQKAINHTAYLMTNANSEKVQADCARNLMDTLKPPETAKVEIDMNVTDNSGIAELKNIMVDLAQNQLEQIERGASTKDIAHVEIYDKDGEKVA